MPNESQTTAHWPGSHMRRRWNEEDDRRLIVWGSCFENGFEYVAEHDLGRTPSAGIRRAQFLKRTKPNWVREIVDEELNRDC